MKTKKVKVLLEAELKNERDGSYTIVLPTFKDGQELQVKLYNKKKNGN